MKNCGRTDAFSLYPAFAIPNGEYLWQTTLPSKRKFHDKSELEVWEKKTLDKTEIINSSKKEVEFKAYFTDKFGKKIFIMSYLLLKGR